MVTILELAVDLRKAISNSSDFGLKFDNLKPRNKSPGGLAYKLIEIKNQDNSLIVLLNRSKSAISLSLKRSAFETEPQQEQVVSLQLSSLNETSRHESLIIRFEAETKASEQLEAANTNKLEEAASRYKIWIFLDCVSQGYLTVPFSLLDAILQDDGPIIVVSNY